MKEYIFPERIVKSASAIAPQKLEFQTLHSGLRCILRLAISVVTRLRLVSLKPIKTENFYSTKTERLRRERAKSLRRRS